MADDFPFDVFLSHSAKDKAVVRDVDFAVGMARCAVRARKAGAMVAVRKHPAALPPGTSQRDVPTSDRVRVWLDAEQIKPDANSH